MPTVGLSPPGRQRFFDAVGAPLAGGKLFTYAAGTTNKQNSYTDSTGATPNANPIILDSQGYCDLWLDTSLGYKLTLAPANDTDPPTAAFWTTDHITPVAFNSVTGNLAVSGSVSVGAGVTVATTLGVVGAATVGGNLAVTGNVTENANTGATLKANTGAAVGGAAPGAGGLAFPAAAVAVADPNTLDDYEEGTWTPVVGGNATYTTQFGTYTKIGRMVHVTGRILINAIGSGSTTTLSGLPFAAGGAGTVDYPVHVGYFASLAISTIVLAGLIQGGTSGMTFTSHSASGTTMSAGDAIFGNGTDVYFDAWYPIS